MATKNKKVENHTGVKVAIAAAAFLAAAGAAFLYGTDAGKVQRKKIKGWALKAKGEILEKLENAKEISEDGYKKIVSDVVNKYTKAKKIQEAELGLFTKEMQQHWNRIKKQLDTKKTTSKVAKK